MRLLLPLLLLSLLPAQQGSPAKNTSPGATFTNGLPKDPKFFPIGVWLQSPHNSKRYQEIGVNLYVGLYGGPTKEQLQALDAAGMRTICAQNEVGLAHPGKTIVAWMHDDEPDNAQAAKIGYGPPIPPHTIVESYEAMRKADRTRPVMLNLGQGAAWDGWHGRGNRTNHPEDYPEYAKGCDLVSFDIYPVTHDKPAVKGKLEFVGKGVQRLVDWTQQRKPVFACIETTHVENTAARPSPEQMRSEVWMAIACGASGIIYFAHEFQPKFVEAGMLAYPEIAAAAKEINREVIAAAPILNSPIVAGVVTVRAEGEIEIAVRCHRDGKHLVLYTASMASTATKVVFSVKGTASGTKVEVLGEKRSLKVDGGKFADEFAPYAIHHYRIGS